MNPERILVLVNPISGRGEGGRSAGRLGRAFQDLGVRAEVVFLPGPGGAGEIIAAGLTGYEAVVAVGGDGTVSEVAGAVFASGFDLPLGLIPLGLSNCLARHLGLPFRMEKAAKVIVRGRLKKVDLALAGDRTVLSFLGAGFDAAVVDRTARRRRGTIRNIDYLRAAAEVLLGREEWPVLSLEVDGRRVEGLFFQIILSALSNYARFFRTPGTEGHQVYLFRGRGPSSLLKSLLKTGLDRNLDRVCDLTLPVKKSLRIEAVKGEGLYQFDGEIGGRLPVECRVHPGALVFFVP
ncbi:MAG: diacylglycerol kinase family protein [Thermodesulfobacteriota bacterium]